MFLAYQTSSAIFNLQNGFSALLQIQQEPLEESCTYELFIIEEYDLDTRVKILEGHCCDPHDSCLKETVCAALQNEKRYIRIFNEYHKNKTTAWQ